MCITILWWSHLRPRTSSLNVNTASQGDSFQTQEEFRYLRESLLSDSFMLNISSEETWSPPPAPGGDIIIWFRGHKQHFKITYFTEGRGRVRVSPLPPVNCLSSKVATQRDSLPQRCQTEANSFRQGGGELGGRRAVDISDDGADAMLVSTTSEGIWNPGLTVGGWRKGGKLRW